MRHRSRQLPGGVSGELSIRVERNDIPDVRQQGKVPRDAGKALGTAAAQAAIQICELASFTFVAHPHPFSFVPKAGSVKKVEDTRPVISIFLVESRDALNGP